MLVLIIIICLSVVGQALSFNDNGSNEIPHYRYIGCFKDKRRARAMPEALGLSWPKGSLASIKKCATISWSNGYQVFGVSYNGRECWSGVNASLTYSRYGNSTGCSNGIGGAWANDVYAFVSVKLIITSLPEPKNVKSGTLVTLFCKVSSSQLPLASITWYRGTNKIPTNIVTMDVYKQGYYWCNASNIPHGAARSERLLLVVTDYFTSIINLKAKENKAKNNKPQNNKPNINDQPQDPCGQIAKYLSSKDKPREYKHAKSALNRWEESNKFSTLDYVIYGKKKNQGEDFYDYYRELLENLKDGAKTNKIQGLKIDWKSILVKDTGMCIKETTGKQNIQGFFTWQSTKIGDSVTVECPLGPSGSSATRRCGGNFDTGAVWTDPNDDICTYKSKKTEAMNNLSKMKLNSRNVKEVAKNFTKLFKSRSAKDMSEADADLAADMVDNILSVEDQLNETADIVVEVIDVVMEMNKEVLAGSSNALTRFIIALDRLNQKIPLEEGSRSRVINSTNVAIQVIEVTRSTFQGVTFGKETERGSSPVATVMSSPNIGNGNGNGNDNGNNGNGDKDDNDGIFVKLPKSILASSIQSSIRIGFIYYANNKLFQSNPQEEDVVPLLSDEVISSSVYNESVQNLTEPVRLTFPALKDSDGNPGTPTTCVFWDVVQRHWSSLGCKLHKTDDIIGKPVECHCNHLTSFSVVFSFRSGVILFGLTLVYLLLVFGCIVFFNRAMFNKNLDADVFDNTNNAITT